MLLLFVGKYYCAQPSKMTLYDKQQQHETADADLGQTTFHETIRFHGATKKCSDALSHGRVAVEGGTWACTGDESTCQFCAGWWYIDRVLPNCAFWW